MPPITENGLITIKTSRRAKRLLKVLAAHTDEHQYKVMERLLSRELAALKIKVV